MKKILLSTTFLFTLILITHAQGFHLGGKVGANLTKINLSTGYH